MLSRTAPGGRVRVTTLVCVAVALGLAGCGGAASRFKSHLDKGQEYYNKGDFAHASVEFRNATQIEPKNVTAVLMSAHAAEKLGKPRAAAGMYQFVIEQSPDNLDAQMSLGRLFVLGGAPQEALRVVTPALVKHPNDAGLLTVRAAARAQQNDDVGARADSELALKNDPTNEEALSLRAGFYTKDHDTEGAIKLLAAAIAQRPQTTELREVLADLYASSGQSAQAEEQLLALVKLRPGDLRYRRALSVFYVRAHRLDDARHALEAAVAASPKEPEPKLALAEFFANQGQAAEGERLLRGYVAKDSEDFVLRFGLADYLRRMGNAKGALEIYSGIAASEGKQPKGLMARDRAAEIEFAAGADDRALALAKEVLALDPHDTDASMIRGQIELKRQDAAAAIADLRAVLRDHPDATRVQGLLANAYLLRGENSLAEQSLRAALDISPQDLSLNVELARLLSGTNRSAEAIKLLQTTVRQNPDNVGVREALTHAYLDAGQFDNARTAAADLEILQPKGALGPYLAGQADEGRKKLDEAAADFKRARTLQPRLMEPLAALAQLQMSRGQQADAIALVKAAIEKDMDARDPAPRNLLGQLLAANHQLPAAIATFNETITLAPKWWPSYRNLGLAQAANGDVPAAIATYESALKLAPTSLQLVNELSALYVRQGNIDAAVNHYEALYRLTPHNTTVANNLAVFLVDHRTDRTSLDRARDLSADFATSRQPGLLDTYGWVRYRRGEFTAALTPLEHAVEQAPDNKEFRYHLGLVQLQTGEKARGRTNLEAAVAGDTPYPWAKDARMALAASKQTG